MDNKAKERRKIFPTHEKEEKINKDSRILEFALRLKSCEIRYIRHRK